jgi:glycosyltransferase involved in cell wall biosynthesis
MNQYKKIYILMATYNGGLYIRAQLDSLLKQAYKNWILYIHDDNSTDTTTTIIKEYQDRYRDKIIYIDDNISMRSAKNNFTYLLNKIDNNFDYLMFCDQDDIWLNTKIEETCNRMMELEAKNSNLPILVFTDLTVVDKDLQPLSKSMMNFQSKDINIINSLKYMLVENIITGCTIMLNKHAKTLALPVSEHAIMHDWWIALKVKQNNGIISYIDNPLILYRQHETNDTGAKQFSFYKALLKFSSFVKYKKTAIDLNLNISLIEIFFLKLSLLSKHIYRKMQE